MKLLDLFCGAGGCAVGYHRAGFEDIVGVDVKPQPRYPFTFVKAGALEFLRCLKEADEIGDALGALNATGGLYLSDFDAIHASPPCQAYSRCKRIGNARPGHTELVDVTRTALESTGKPWVIENVEGAPLNRPLMLCGSMFGLPLIRHRLFESSVMLMNGTSCSCSHGERFGVYANKVTKIGTRAAAYTASSGRTHYRPQLGTLAEGQRAMGIDWMNRDELSQAIPPAYTEHVGLQLLEHITVSSARFAEAA